MTLLEYIKNQLLFNDSVTLPGLGSFEIRRIPSQIRGKKIIPPSVQVAFNTERSLDDGTLAKSIALAEEITQEEAGQRVLEYIDEILFALNKDEDFVFDGFGRLFRDPDNIFRFVKDEAFQIDFDSYGLESFELDPVDETIAQEDKTDSDSSLKPGQREASHTLQGNGKTGSHSAKQETKTRKQTSAEKIPAGAAEASTEKGSKNNRNIFWILTGAAMVILISFVLIRMSTSLLDGTFSDIEQSDVKDILSEDENADVEPSSNADLEQIIDSLTLQENALTIEESPGTRERPEIKTSGYKEFHIIAGSFKDKENAGILQQSLTEKGYPALVIQQGDKLYRVSAMSFKDKEKGLTALRSFKQKTKNNAAWLLSLN